jgi:hypothetical protein
MARQVGQSLGKLSIRAQASNARGQAGQDARRGGEPEDKEVTLSPVREARETGRWDIESEESGAPYLVFEKMEIEVATDGLSLMFLISGKEFASALERLPIPIRYAAELMVDDLWVPVAYVGNGKWVGTGSVKMDLYAVKPGDQAANRRAQRPRQRRAPGGPGGFDGPGGGGGGRGIGGSRGRARGAGRGRRGRPRGVGQGSSSRSNNPYRVSPVGDDTPLPSNMIAEIEFKTPASRRSTS